MSQRGSGALPHRSEVTHRRRTTTAARRRRDLAVRAGMARERSPRPRLGRPQSRRRHSTYTTRRRLHEVGGHRARSHQDLRRRGNPSSRTNRSGSPMPAPRPTGRRASEIRRILAVSHLRRRQTVDGLHDDSGWTGQSAERDQRNRSCCKGRGNRALRPRNHCRVRTESRPETRRHGTASRETSRSDGDNGDLQQGEAGHLGRLVEQDQQRSTSGERRFPNCDALRPQE